MAFYTINNKFALVDNKYWVNNNVIPKLTKLDFNFITSVINSLQTNQSAICIIRHSTRDNDKSGKLDGLNPEGIVKAKEIGLLLKMLNPNIDIFYGSTGVTRCAETAFYVSQGYGDNKFNNWTDVPSSFDTKDKTHNIDYELSFINGDFFTEETNWTNVLPSAKANDLQEHGSNVINLATAYWASHGKHKLSLLVSHDNYEVPFIAYASGLKSALNQTYNIELTPDKWCNYMSGVVIIIENNLYKNCYPLRCFDSGILAN